jgi:hypothetical protein
LTIEIPKNTHAFSPKGSFKIEVKCFVEDYKYTKHIQENQWFMIEFFDLFG